MQQLRKEIARLESTLERNQAKQVHLLAAVDTVHQFRRTYINNGVQAAAASTTIDSIGPQQPMKQVELQLPSADQIGPRVNGDFFVDDCCSEECLVQSSPSHLSNPCVYSHVLDRIQRLEQYLTRPCRHCQQACLSLNHNNNAQTDTEGHLTVVDQPPPLNSPLLSQPIIMQGHIDSQRVTLFNRSAVELVTKLQEVYAKRTSLETSYRNTVELVSESENQLVEMNALLNDCTAQLQTIANLKDMEDTLQDQNWQDMQKLIDQLRSRSSVMSKLMRPKNLLANESFTRMLELVDQTATKPPLEDVSPKLDTKDIAQKERRVAKEDGKLRNKNRKKKESAK